MRKEIIINSAINEVRVAITEEGHLVEYFVELPEKEKLIGNVYYGRINKVSRGIDAAFVDIGMNQDAFLSFSDVDDSYTYAIDGEGDNEIDRVDYDEEFSNEIKKDINKSTRDLAVFSTKYSGDVVINLQVGKEVLVQAVREPYAHKGMKLSTKIAIPGRYAILMPFENSIGISKKIRHDAERNRLRRIARSVLPKGFGCVIRTASMNKKDNDLLNDWNNVLSNWNKVEQNIQLARKTQTPSLVYQDMTLATSIIRDHFNKGIFRVVVDSSKLYNTIISYLEIADPNSIDKIELYKGATPIFEALSIERELRRTNNRILTLPNGGNIVIDRTEALTVIDVNSGRAKETDRDQNILKTNLEAGYEISKQIRLRDIGGIIVIDFIDMFNEEHRRILHNEMVQMIKYDRAKVVVFSLTQLGLMQITRQRVHQNLVEKISNVCPTCSGRGRIASNSALLNAIEKWLKKYKKYNNDFKIELLVHPHVAEFLTEGHYPIISKLMIKYFLKIIVLQVDTIPVDSFKINSIRTQKDITADYS